MSLIVLTRLLIVTALGSGLLRGQRVITDDLDRFYAAFDAIQATADTSRHALLLDSLFVGPASPGQRAMFAARRYRPEEYLANIRDYPKFWRSLRDNVETLPGHVAAMQTGVDRLARIYPDLRPAAIYFTVGAFRSGGTIVDDMVLIGSEISLGDGTTDVSEFRPEHEWLQSLYTGQLGPELVFTNVHEFVHTQQIPTIGDRLLYQTLYEGIAEFTTTLALDRASYVPAVAYGRRHADSIRSVFTREMLFYDYDDWLWNNQRDDIAMGDLGYYVGYAIAEAFYQQRTDSPAAVRTLIELDYSDQDAVFALIDASGYLPRPLMSYYRAFEAARPRVTDLAFTHDSGDWSVGDTTFVTLFFSERMDTTARGFDYGPLGAEQVLPVRRVLGWAADGKRFRFAVVPPAGGRRQVMVSIRFRSATGYPLLPHLIEVELPE